MDPQLRTAILDRLGQSDRCPGCGRFRGSDHTCPTPDGLPAGDYADLRGEDRVKAMISDLEDSVKAIVDSGQLHRWLDAMASNGLRRWSANNRLLALVQMLQRGKSLDGLHLMGFRQWEKLNRKVAKGAKAVWILAPGHPKGRRGRRRRRHHREAPRGGLQRSPGLRRLRHSR